MRGQERGWDNRRERKGKRGRWGGKGEDMRGEERGRDGGEENI